MRAKVATLDRRKHNLADNFRQQLAAMGRKQSLLEKELSFERESKRAVASKLVDAQQQFVALASGQAGGSGGGAAAAAAAEVVAPSRPLPPDESTGWELIKTGLELAVEKLSNQLEGAQAEVTDLQRQCGDKDRRLLASRLAQDAGTGAGHESPAAPVGVGEALLATESAALCEKMREWFEQTCPQPSPPTGTDTEGPAVSRLASAAWRHSWSCESATALAEWAVSQLLTERTQREVSEQKLHQANEHLRGKVALLHSDVEVNIVPAMQERVEHLRRQLHHAVTKTASFDVELGKLRAREQWSQQRTEQLHAYVNQVQQVAAASTSTAAAAAAATTAGTSTGMGSSEAASAAAVGMLANQIHSLHHLVLHCAPSFTLAHAYVLPALTHP